MAIAQHNDISNSRGTPASLPAVSAIVPTYGEAENLPELVARIDAAMAEGPSTTEIIIVDDNSPDNTREVCAELAKSFPLRLIVRTAERGLASAVIKGLASAKGSVLVVMDADLSHPPEAIPALVAAIDGKNFIIAIGSRYTHGGSIEEQWGWGRRTLSRIATQLARPLSSVSDPMSGFFAISRHAFQSVENRLNPIGYKIGLELIVKLRCANVAEVPIDFSQRKRGRSKLGFREKLDYLRHLGALYLYKFRK
jgi:dolichol-phosphate mannosyltransferase